LNSDLNQKFPIIAQRKRKVILSYNNARPLVTEVVKNTSSALQWEVLITRS